MLGTHELLRIFDKNETKIELVSSDATTPVIRATSLQSSEAFRRCIEETGCSPVCFILLQQRNTWSRLRISAENFDFLLDRFHVFPLFWGFVAGFGLKTGPIDENHIDLRSRLSAKNRDHASSLQICYNIRYMAKHNRSDTKNPWSERQVAVYHSYQSSEGKSRWIIVQAPADVKVQLERLVTQTADTTARWIDSVNVHLFLFAELALAWREWIKYLEQRLSKLDEKALYSTIGNVRKFDYSVSFQDVQSMELLRRRLMKTCLILQLNTSVARKWRDQVLQFTESEMIKVSLQNAFETLHQHIGELETHSKVAESLLSRLDGTSKLLFQLLEHKNDHVQLQINSQSQSNSDKMRIIAEAARNENESVTQLTQDIHADSKFIKTLTFTALLYTPASLVATIFSSNLVHVVDTTSPGGSTRFALSSGFYLFPILTLALIFLTISSLFVWQRCWPICRQKLKRL